MPPTVFGTGYYRVVLVNPMSPAERRRGDHPSKSTIFCDDAMGAVEGALEVWQEWGLPSGRWPMPALHTRERKRIGFITYAGTLVSNRTPSGKPVPFPASMAQPVHKVDP